MLRRNERRLATGSLVRRAVDWPGTRAAGARPAPERRGRRRGGGAWRKGGAAGRTGGGGGVVVVHGEAGVGKTALLEYVVEAAREFRTARTSGVEAEMELPFAAVQQ